MSDLSISSQHQIEEVEILKSIFGDDFKILSDSPLEFEVDFTFTPPPSFSFIMEQQISETDEIRSTKDPTDVPKNEILSNEVSFLPPLSLNCIVPTSYPVNLFEKNIESNSEKLQNSSFLTLSTSDLDSDYPSHFPHFSLVNSEWIPKSFWNSVITEIQEEIEIFRSQFQDQTDFLFLSGQCPLYNCVERIRMSIETFLFNLNPSQINLNKNFSEYNMKCEKFLSIIQQPNDSQDVENLETTTNQDPHESEEILRNKVVERYYGYILRYNHSKRIEVFKTSIHSCMICYSDKIGTDFGVLPCGHNTYCLKCLSEYCNTNIQSGEVFKLNCPDPSCKVSLPKILVESLLSREVYEKWERLVREKTLELRADVTNCPRCQEIVYAELEESFGNCKKCCYPFCIVCREAYHPVTPCIPSGVRLQKVLRTVQDQQKERNRINELKNLAYIDENAMRCPHCRSAVQKFEGCNKMTCANCGKYFCYICGAPIQSYDHFKSGSCILFDMEWNPDELRFNLQFGNDRRDRRPRNVNIGNNVQFKSCPSCGQANTQVNGNNNHVTCWSCRKQFCFQCSSVIKGTSHFLGGSQCKQHSS